MWGKPMRKWPYFDDDQIYAVVKTLKSGKVNAWTGTDVADFEANFAKYFGSKHAIALANGSVTLNLALQCLDLQPGDEVIVSPRSFVASASCVLLFGAIPVFADVDKDSQNITVETIAPLLTKKTKGIIPVHLGGWPCDMIGIMALAKKHDLWVIEDCAQAHGAKIDGIPVGSFGNFGSYSFCQDKIMTTGGEGGMLVTEDPNLWAKAWSFKDHGKNHDTVFHKTHPPGFRWLHESLGTNYRMTGLSAAIGNVQLEKLDGWSETRRNNAQILAQTATEIPLLRTPMPENRMHHAWYRFYTFIRPEKLARGWTRDRIIQEISDRGFSAFSGSCSEIYLEKIFTDRGLGPEQSLPVAKELGLTSLAFLVDPTVDQDQIQALGLCLKDVCQKACV